MHDKSVGQSSQQLVGTWRNILVEKSDMFQLENIEFHSQYFQVYTPTSDTQDQHKQAKFLSEVDSDSLNLSKCITTMLCLGRDLLI